MMIQVAEHPSDGPAYWDPLADIQVFCLADYRWRTPELEGRLPDRSTRARRPPT